MNETKIIVRNFRIHDRTAIPNSDRILNSEFRIADSINVNFYFIFDFEVKSENETSTMCCI